MSELTLALAIIARSDSRDWDAARREWHLTDVFVNKNGENCLCGHYPAIEICVLRNHVNGCMVDIGNCCIRKFSHIQTRLIFDGIKRISNDIEAALNEAVIDYALRKRWLSVFEDRFLIDTRTKRNLSQKQLTTRIIINKKILARVFNEHRIRNNVKRDKNG